MKKLLLLLVFLTFSLPLFSEEKYPLLDNEGAKRKVEEVMEFHVSEKSFNSELAKRALENFINNLDPAKTYWIREDIKKYLEPSEDLLGKVVADFNKADFSTFEEIYDKFLPIIERRRGLEEEVEKLPLKEGVKVKEFRKMEWANGTEGLKERLWKIRTLRMEALEKLDDEEKSDIALQRIAKYRKSHEDELLTSDQDLRQHIILSYIVKSIVSSFDTHTAFFSPSEASDFLVDVQNRLFGIGVLLRDDLVGLTVTKIIEGGPTEKAGALKVKDRLIAVNGESIVGMAIQDAVQMIRGKEGTVVSLTVVRPGEKEEDKEETLEVKITRGEVVLKENRVETTLEPYGDGVIASIHLYSFYKNPHYSSSSDVQNELERLMREENLKGVILDLRFNTGGLLVEAVELAGLFITKGVIASVKDEKGNIQHLRDLDGRVVYDGPLFILMNRASASASEIVAQTLQDYGRALVVGDDFSYGKGSFQTLSVDTRPKGSVNPEGEYKVTRGRYYTVSGKSPQKEGVKSDIIVPGALTGVEIGENFDKFPLEGDHIPPSFEDDLADLPWPHRVKYKQLYLFDLQEKSDGLQKYLTTLKKNSEKRIEANKNYQNFLKEIEKEDLEEEDVDKFGHNDLQLIETFNIMKDYIYMSNQNLVYARRAG